MKRRHFCKTTIAAAVAVSFHRELALAALAEGSAVSADIKAVTGAGKEVLLKQSAVEELAASLRRNVALPGSVAYESARLLLNPRVNRYPTLVEQPLVPTDVCSAVKFARQENLVTAMVEQVLKDRQAELRLLGRDPSDLKEVRPPFKPAPCSAAPRRPKSRLSRRGSSSSRSLSAPGIIL